MKVIVAGVRNMLTPNQYRTFVFGGPGPDVTVVKLVEDLGETFRCWDMIFNFEVVVEKHKLKELTPFETGYFRNYLK